jgi:predicted ATPase
MCRSLLCGPLRIRHSPPCWSELRAASPERVKRELAAFVAHIAAVRPLVVAIDDLHWADASTVEVLAYLLSKPDLERVLLVCAYRQTEMTLSAHPFVSVRHELMKRRILVEVPLRRFSRQETACYLDLVFPENRFPKELAEVVQARSNGNPLFVSEIARDLMERGAVRRREGRWCIEASLDQVRSSLPASIQSVIERKLEQLDADDKILMMAASLQGVEFDSRLAAIAAGCPVSDAEQRLARLLGSLAHHARRRRRSRRCHSGPALCLRPHAVSGDLPDGSDAGPES